MSTAARSPETAALAEVQARGAGRDPAGESTSGEPDTKARLLDAAELSRRLGAPAGGRDEGRGRGEERDERGRRRSGR